MNDAARIVTASSRPPTAPPSGVLCKVYALAFLSEAPENVSAFTDAPTSSLLALRRLFEGMFKPRWYY